MVRAPHRVRRKAGLALYGSPQRLGDVMRPIIVTPKKPNSARRPAVRVYLTSARRAICHVPGSGHNLRKHSDTLIRGGGARDLPGVYHTCIRGVQDLLPSTGKSRRRSIYGMSRPDRLVKKLRRRYREAVS